MNDLINSHNVNNDLVANPFGAAVNPLGGSSIGTAQTVSHELAEMQAQIYLAKQFPRDQMAATDKILTACQRPGLAEVAIYSYSRGGTNIAGPSIRLAEEIARNWGNLECGWNELERRVDSSVIRAFAWDKESNVLKTLVFTVPHYRTTKLQHKRITDERDLYELLANQAARRMRNCILALIPGDVVEAAVAQCEKTMVTHVDISPESLKKLVEAFAQFGVTKAQIEKRIQRKLDSIAPAQFVRMREIYTSLNDGMSDPADWFEPEPEPEKTPSANATAATNSLKAALNAQKAAQDAPVEHSLINNQGDADDAQSARSGAKNAGGKKTTAKLTGTALADSLRARIVAAKSKKELTTVVDEIIRDDTLPDAERDALYHLVDDVSIKLDEESGAGGKQ